VKADKIGWTAQYTAAVWAGLGVPGTQRFVTRRGKFLKWWVDWGGGLLGLRGQYSVTNLFLAPRYLGINTLLAQRQPKQVIELAAGLSARGYEWARNNQGRYVEVDQPKVVAAKEKIVGGRSHLPQNFFLVSADLRQPNWVSKVLPNLDCAIPTLIICEGLTGYLNQEALSTLLSAIGDLAVCFDQTTIWLDLYLKLDRHTHGRVFGAMLPAQIVWQLGRAPMQMFLEDVNQVKQVLNANGFKTRYLWSSSELAALAKYKAPPLDLFYLAEITL